MRGSIIGSATVHLAILVSLFVVKYSAPLIAPGDVVQVALYDAPVLRSPPPAPAPKPKEPEPEAPKIKPSHDTGVKLAPPKPKPKPKEPEKAKEEEPAPQTPAVPYVRVGTSGLAGAVSVDAANFEFTYYLLLVRNRIASSWTPPSGLVTGGQQVRAVIYFRIARNGTITGVAVETPSSREFFDRSALRAVAISNPMPPLPEGYKGGDLGVHFGFEYGGP